MARRRRLPSSLSRRIHPCHLAAPAVESATPTRCSILLQVLVVLNREEIGYPVAVVLGERLHAAPLGVAVAVGHILTIRVQSDHYLAACLVDRVEPRRAR